jgi:sulfide:quinone oxidoreductase
VESVEHAVTWWPEGDPEAYSGLLRDVEEGYARRLVFAIPGGAVWPLPLYELALMTARDASGMGVDAEITVVTPEAVPLLRFGPAAAAALREELEAAGIRLEPASLARVERTDPYSVVLQPSGRRVEADRVIAIPEVVGPRVSGLPQDELGFIPTEADGRVRGTDRVWAAGDGIAYPVKYGGLATQQADIAAAAIARSAGAAVEDAPARLVIRGVLMTGAAPRAIGSSDAPPSGSTPLWRPEGKISGRYLSPYLESRAAARGAAPAGGDVAPADQGVVVEQELPALDAGESDGA